ncbi:MAG: galactonate dehydratase [Clostridia bacterium]|nr:galactonate dehydratase [Clostridia bacterium]MDR3644063.1 galactonate dehydratase [Clostridia bacterium]
MKITDVKTYIVHADKDNWVYTKVFTDEGITGLGESSVEGKELTVREAVSELKRYLIGKDPFQIEKHAYVMNRDGYWGSGAILSGAISAIDGALWDIKGKALNVPVYELLGGKFRDRIRVYANRWFFGADTPCELAKKAAATVEKGYTALKWDPFEKAECTISNDVLKRALQSIRAVRDAVGDEVDILIEGHGRFNISTAIRVSREMEEYRPMFFEEPVMPDNIEALAEVRSKTNIPIAAGERFYTKSDFKIALDKKAIDFAQPDLRETGGITEAKKIAALCESCFVPVAPHNIHGIVGTAMSLQLVAAIPNAVILEHSVEEIEWKEKLFDHSIRPVNGYITIPGRPGLGLELDETIAQKYPFKPMSMIELMFD